MIYFEVIHSFVSAIKDRFEQPSFNLFSDVEQLWLKSDNGEDYHQELDNFLKIFKDDINPSALLSELSIISTTCKGGNPAHFHDIFSYEVLSKNERHLMKNFITIVKIMLVNGTITATPER